MISSKQMKQKLAFYSLYLAWMISLAAVFGSLYFSEIAKFPPCVLCWYQRIFLYPLALLIPVGMFRKDKSLPFYVLPLIFIGTLISIYHNMLQYGLISEELSPCTLGVSCVTKYVEFFGFISIPFLALLSFVIIGILMVYNLKVNRELP